MSSFRNFIKSHGFTLIDIVGDGNCLFRAFSYILFGTEDRHLEIRNSVVDYMESREKELCNFQETELPWDRYVFNMRQLGTFGGYLEIFVFASIYKCRVGVLQLGMPMHYIEGRNERKNESARGSISPSTTSNESSVYYLAYHDFQHYSVLEKIPRLPNK